MFVCIFVCCRAPFPFVCIALMVVILLKSKSSIYFFFISEIIHGNGGQAEALVEISVCEIILAVSYTQTERSENEGLLVNESCPSLLVLTH